MLLKIKICGITRPEDALAAVEAGADALGFMFYPKSPRSIDLAHARRMIELLPPFIAKVGVFVNPSDGAVREAIDACGIDTLQFHGDEPPNFGARFGLKTIKAFRIRDRASLDLLSSYRREAWLLDAFVSQQWGGTGARFEWALAVEARQRDNHPILLAGGLTPENVRAAIGQVQPFGVDVSSGVESEPRKKSREKMRRFIWEAREAASMAEETGKSHCR